MVKLKDGVISAEDITEYLASQDDFALELYVYSQARRLGLTATHGGTYEDPVTKKPRQYDVRSSIMRGSFHRIDLAIECKSLRQSYPLLISRINRIEEESFHKLIHSIRPSEFSRSSAHTPLSLVNGKVAVARGSQSIYPPSEYVGKSTAQIGRNEKGEFVSNDSEVYDKWSQALASASELITDAEYHHKIPSGYCMTLVIPVLVVSDGTLWVADYSDDGMLQSTPQQVDQALLYVGKDYWNPMGLGYTVSHLHVYTKTGVCTFLEQIAKEQSFWDSAFPECAMSPDAMSPDLVGF